MNPSANCPRCRAFQALTLLLAWVMLLAAPLPAQEESPEAGTEEATVVEEACLPGDQGCEPAPPEPVPQKNRQQISEDVAENTQDALSLRRLLLGRSYSFFGRVEPDYAAYFDGILEDEDGFELRRLRAGVVGVMSDKISYKGELDLTDGSNNFSDFYMQWDTDRFGSFRIGNQRVAQNLSAMTGSLSLLFMERPLPVTTFSLARRLAISNEFYFTKFGVHGVIFTKDPNNDAGKYGASLRVIVNPVRSSGGVAHLGFSLVREKMDREARYRTRPESHVTNIWLVDTGGFADVDYQNIAGVEFAGAKGALSGRIEAFASRWERAGSRENDFFGAYIEIGRFLTGQDFRYVDGKFVRPQIEAGSRAWELGFRASWVDLNDGEVRGGEQKNLGLALNFYGRRGFRAMFNVIYYDAKRDVGDEEGWFAQGRAQLSW